MRIFFCLSLIAVLAVSARADEAEAWRESFERAAGLAKKGEAQEATKWLQKSFEDGLDDPSVALTDARFDPIRADRRFRSALRSVARKGPLHIVSDDEPGTPLIIRAEIRDAKNRPAASAIVYAYQTDASGSYTREDAMDEPHARIFGFARTDARGRIEIHTVHPGVYPERMDVEGPARFIPEHVHLQITLWDGSIHEQQLVFEDSPRMRHGYWKDWAAEHEHPVAKLQSLKDGRELCQFVLQLRP